MHRDGYRADLAPGPPAGRIVLRVYRDGGPVAEAVAWEGDWSDPADEGEAERLWPLLLAMCRFLNTGTRPGQALAQLREVVARCGLLPDWCLSGVTYVATRDEADVVYALADGRHLRVVEDQFAEVLGPEEFQAWLAERDDELARAEARWGGYDG